MANKQEHSSEIWLTHEEEKAVTVLLSNFILSGFTEITLGVGVRGVDGNVRIPAVALMSPDALRSKQLTSRKPFSAGLDTLLIVTPGGLGVRGSSLSISPDDVDKYLPEPEEAPVVVTGQKLFKYSDLIESGQRHAAEGAAKRARLNLK